MTLSDRFGEHGLISLVILEKQADALFIDTWIMSCRVLRRGVEDALFNAVAGIAKECGAKKLIGEYLPTAKNRMVEGFYAGYGMTPVGGGRYELNPEDYQPRAHLIHVR
jgi:FkbH-like protein